MALSLSHSHSGSLCLTAKMGQTAWLRPSAAGATLTCSWGDAHFTIANFGSQADIACWRRIYGAQESNKVLPLRWHLHNGLVELRH